MIYLHVNYAMKPGQEPAVFVKAMVETGLLADIRAEEGCHQYDYYLPFEGDGLFLAECWEDEDALQKHQQGDAMRRYKAMKDTYIADTDIKRIMP